MVERICRLIEVLDHEIAEIEADISALIKAEPGRRFSVVSTARRCAISRKQAPFEDVCLPSPGKDRARCPRNRVS